MVEISVDSPGILQPKLSKPSKAELVDIIRLIRSENVGSRTFWHLLSIYQNAGTALNNVAELSCRGGRTKPIKLYSKDQAEDEIAICEAKSVKILPYSHSEFPKLLKNIEDCPPLLFCLGNIKLLNRKNIAVIGSRNPSLNGLRFAYKIAKNLTENNITVVSGFARGIDSAAHKASIENGTGSTIGVLAGGIDHIYPPENKELYYKIIEQGLMIAELPLGAIPKSQNFPQRNRIISGLSYGVAVIEASLKSGSLITAKFALNQGREVFAVPGFPLDPHYQGNNYILKQGGYILESVEDILEVIDNAIIKRSVLFEQKQNFVISQPSGFLEKELTQARVEIINLLSASPTAVDEIIAVMSLPARLVLTIIVELELADKIIRHQGNKISIRM